MLTLKQIIRLYNDGISIREITRRLGLSRNSVRKYLGRFRDEKGDIADQQIVDQAYNSDLLDLEAERMRQLTEHFHT